MSDFTKKKLNMSLDEIGSMNKRFNQRRRYDNRLIYGNKYSSNNSGQSSRNYLQRRRNNSNRFHERNYQNRFNQRGFNTHPSRRYNDRRRKIIRWNKARTGSTAKNNNQSEDARTRLLVSNLHSSIVNNELKKIFENIGPLKRCGIRWDNLGNSLGTADVEYDSPLDAEKAIKCFNNAEIEGTIMKVEYNTEKRSNPKKRVFTKRLGFRKK